MRLLEKALAAVVVALVFAAPLAATAHCEGDQVTECAPECVCVCHSTPAFSDINQENGLMAYRIERAHSHDLLCLGRLPLADIFRPPISA